jgi:acid phosphatase class B
MYSKIAFDIDGIVFETAPHVLRKYNELYGTQYLIDDWTTYNFEECFNQPQEQISEAFDTLVSTEDIPFMRGAVRGLREFQEKVQDEIVFITTRGDWQAEIGKKKLEETLEMKVSVFSEKHRKVQPKKMSTLQEVGVKFFVEDNSTHWKTYISSGIFIGTFILPYTKKAIAEMEEFCEVSLFPFLHWDHLTPFLIQLVDILEEYE